MWAHTEGNSLSLEGGDTVGDEPAPSRLCPLLRCSRVISRSASPRLPPQHLGLMPQRYRDTFWENLSQRPRWVEHRKGGGRNAGWFYTEPYSNKPSSGPAGPLTNGHHSSYCQTDGGMGSGQRQSTDGGVLYTKFSFCALQPHLDRGTVCPTPAGMTNFMPWGTSWVNWYPLARYL